MKASHARTQPQASAADMPSPCANASLESYYPECLRWSEAPPEKNAGLSFFNGTALPDLAKYRRERADLYAQCQQRAAATFPAYAALERGGRLANFGDTGRACRATLWCASPRVSSL